MIKLLWLIIWGVAFGYIEAAVVVYLREIYYPDGFTFPVLIIQDHIILIEVLREAMTLIIIWATAYLSYRILQSQIAAFIVLFGIWDIFYYIFLKLLLNWPESLNTCDILFLIPVPWVGPVWAPVLVSLGFIYVGTSILIRNYQSHLLHFNKRFILLELIAALLIIISFIIPGSSVVEQSIPIHFPWYIFLIGFLTGLGIFLYYFYNSKNTN